MIRNVSGMAARSFTLALSGVARLISAPLWSDAADKEYQAHPFTPSDVRSAAAREADMIVSDLLQTKAPELFLDPQTIPGRSPSWPFSGNDYDHDKTFKRAVFVELLNELPARGFRIRHIRGTESVMVLPS